MISLVAEPPLEYPYSTEFTPGAVDVEHKGPSDLEMNLAGKGISRVLVGEPQTTDLLAVWPSGTPIDPEIRELNHAWDFLAVRLACSFVPARGSRLTWVRLNAELAGHGPDVRALAHDLFPRSISRPVNYHRRYSVTPSLKFSFVEASVAAEKEETSIELQPQMDSSGLLTNTPGWTFRSDDRSGLSGSREMFMIVRVQKKSAVTIAFRVNAEARGRLGPIPLRRTNESAELSLPHVLRP